MNRHATIVPWLLAWSLALTPGRAADSTMSVEIDIGSQRENTTIERTLDIHGPTRIKLIITGIRTSDRHDVSVHTDGVVLPALTLAPASFATLPSGPAGFTSLPHGLQTMDDSADGTHATAGSAPGSAPSSASSASGRSTVDTARYQMPGTTTLLPGQRMTVVVRRLASSGDHVWTIVLTSPARGAWRISFGFAFAIMLMPDREYVLRREGTDGLVIRRASDQSAVNANPVFMLHWFPRDDQWSDWSLSLTAGLGLDVSDPTVLLGGSLTFNQNVTVAVGIMAMKLKRLNPRYTEGMQVSDDPGEEFLCRQVYGINPFTSLTFRFADNLFGK